VVEGDALAIDEATLTGGAPFKVVANLPYNIATPLLIKWLKRVHGQPGLVRGLVLMFQREVAERIVAKPGGKTYGRLSVLAQWLTEARLLFDVAPSAFVPPPKVVSSVIRLAPRPGPLSPADLSDLEKVVAAAFGQRRKMLRSALRGLGDAEALCREAGIEPTERAERISVEGFCALARAYGGLSHLR
ncbi:MAG: ribosomal RNA small subunit methyltransferase A, partial [Alphaproteobacteria bacterium]|nr:ribosomal RNA small subunit methyltransferase A [Alphaproteobacteria bacterium]